MTESFSDLRAKIANTVSNDGLCKCKSEPMGDKGLEGYVAGLSYRFEHMTADMNGYPYFRVYPASNFTDYYETCGESTFHKYFEITEASR